MGLLQGKVALITGAGSGIGRAAAALFAREGAKVVIAEIDEAAGKATLDEIAKAGGEARYIRTDVTEPESVEAAVHAAVDGFGGLNILYNNVGGTNPKDSSVVDVDLEVFWDTMRRDLFGTVLGCRFGIPFLKKAGGGAIINMSSVVAVVGRPSPAKDSYTIAKGGISAMTRGLAVDLAPFNIRVNAIAPGTTLSPRVAGNMREGRLAERIKQRHLLGFIEPEDIANGALYLASDMSRKLTGQILSIDSGWSMS